MILGHLNGNDIKMETNSIKDKKILFICFPFYEYEKLIKKELENLGAEVDFYPGKFHKEDFRDNSNFIVAFVSFLLNPLYKKKYTKGLYDYIRAKNKIYDILFVIQTYPASKGLIKKLKTENPLFKSYIYFWDAFSLYNYSNKIKYFDYAFSLDRADCKKHKGLKHLHGFYPDINVNNRKKNIIYDWSYIGSVYPMSSYRIDFINKLIENSKRQNLSFYARLKYYKVKLPNSKFIKLFKNIYYNIFHPKHVSFFRKIQKYLSKNFLFTDTIKLETVLEIQSQSRCIIDINYRKRSGITFQCFPVIAENKKLITTNKYIAYEDFFNPNNILIIDEKDPYIALEFLQKSCVPVDISYLRLDNWLKTIFNIGNIPPRYMIT